MYEGRALARGHHQVQTLRIQQGLHVLGSSHEIIEVLRGAVVGTRVRNRSGIRIPIHLGPCHEARKSSPLSRSEIGGINMIETRVYTDGQGIRTMTPGAGRRGEIETKLRRVTTWPTSVTSLTTFLINPMPQTNSRFG